MQHIRNQSTLAARWLAMITFAFLSVAWAAAQEGGFYFVVKGQDFIQTGPGAPTLRTDKLPFVFLAAAHPPPEVVLDSATVRRLPDGAINALTAREFGDEYNFERRFAAKAPLDAAFPSGSYRFTFVSEGDTVTPTLTLGPDAYPANAPQAANWTSLQMADATADIPVLWNVFPGGTAGDYVQFMVEGRSEGSDHFAQFFSTPPPGSPDALNGTNTSVIIPANTLAPGATYYAHLLFAKFVGRNTSAIEDATGITAYYKETRFELVTANPNGTLQFSSPVYTGTETGAVVTISVRRVAGSQGEVSVTCQTTGGSATADGDYSSVSNRLTFTEGTTNRTFAIAIANDDDAEGYETVTLQLSDATGGATFGTPNMATLVIIDDDSPAGPSVNAYLAAKGQHFIQTGPGAPALRPELPFNINLSVLAGFPGAVASATVRLPNNVVLNLEPDMYSPSLDYEQEFASKAALSAMFPAGQYVFTLNTVLDGSRTSNLVMPPDGARFPNAPHVTNLLAAQLIDADAPFTLLWRAFESAAAADMIRVEVRDPMGERIFGSPEFLTPDVLRGAATMFNLPAGALPVGAALEGDLTFVRLAVLDTNSYPGVPGVVAFFSETRFPLHTLEPAPPQGRLQFAEPIFVAGETQGLATVVISRTGGSAGEVSVFVGTSNGTATAGLDFTDASRQISFLPGETNKTVSIPLFDDDLLEGSESVRLSLASPMGGAVLGLLTNALLVIHEEEVRSAGMLQFSHTNYVVHEGAPAAAITIHRAGGKSGEVSVEFATSELSATDGIDYTGSRVTLVFSNGVMARTVLIPIINDALDEPPKAFAVALRHPSGGASLGPRIDAIVKIEDNDRGGVIHFAAPKSAISETGGVAVINVVRSGGGAGDVTVRFNVTGGTAEADADFYVTHTTLTFGSNVTSQSIYVTINDNATLNPERTVVLTLSAPTGGARLGGLTNHTLRILNDEVSLQFGKASYTNRENERLAVITVVRSGPRDGVVSVDYTTEDDSAVSTMDYRVARGTLVFGPGVGLRAFGVVITNDTIVEGAERLGVRLSNPTHALLGDISQAPLYLLDNDEGGEISFAETNYVALETAPAALIRIKRAHGHASGVTVHFEAAGGTATPGQDYMPVSTNLTFAAGETMKVVAVPLILDTAAEPVETILLTLSEPTGGATLGRTEAMVTILNRPDINTVSATGEAFLKLTLTGAEGFALHRALAIVGQGLRTSGINPVTTTLLTNVSVANQFLSATGSIAKAGTVGAVQRMSADTFVLNSFAVTNTGVFTSFVPVSWMFNESSGTNTTAAFSGGFQSGVLKIDVYQTDGAGKPTVIAGRIDAVLMGPDARDTPRRAILKGSFRFKP